MVDFCFGKPYQFMPFHIIRVLRITLYYTELIGITCIIYIYTYMYIIYIYITYVLYHINIYSIILLGHYWSFWSRFNISNHKEMPEPSRAIQSHWPGSHCILSGDFSQTLRFFLPHQSESDYQLTIDDWRVHGGTVIFLGAWQDFLLEANLVYLLHVRKRGLNPLEFLDVWKMARTISVSQESKENDLHPSSNLLLLLQLDLPLLFSESFENTSICRGGHPMNRLHGASKDLSSASQWNPNVQAVTKSSKCCGAVQLIILQHFFNY